MYRFVSFTITMVFVLALLTGGAFATDYYVATNGGDNNAGTLALPFATIQKAADTMSAGDNCYIRGGSYHEEVDLSGVAGSSGKPITFTFSSGTGLRAERADIGTVTNNRFYQNSYACASDGKPSPATVMLMRSHDIVFRRNTINVSGSAQAVKLGKRDDRPWISEYNYFTACGLQQTDGAAQYSYQSAATESVSRYNWFYGNSARDFRWDGPNDPVVTGVHANVYRSVAMDAGRKEGKIDGDGYRLKGDFHEIYNNLGIGDRSTMNVALDKGGNANSITHNNAADNFTDDPIPGIASHNFVGQYESKTLKDLLRDPDNWDFRPRADAVELIDQGTSVTCTVNGQNIDVTAGFNGAAPDIGAYEYGDTEYWIPGRIVPQASMPVPPSGNKNVKLDADLMWLGGLGATSYNVYFGTDPQNLVYQGSQTNNIFSPGPLAADTVYCWRVDSIGPDGTVTGDVWTADTTAPTLSVNPVTGGATADADVPSYLRGHEELYADNPRKAAKQWFDDADFGLFIHYGLYSLAEGYWGDVHSRPAEWVQLRAKIPVKEYEELADRFTAENFDADFITDLALDAGMKYINITTRHHDSFCLFDTKYTEFNSVNSAAKRDLIAELAEQCQKKGLGLFLYYSHGRDWRHAHAPNNDEWGGAPRPKYDPPEASYRYGDEHDLNLYVEFMKNQITELLTNYGPVAGIWLDGRGVLRSRPDATEKFKLQELYDHIHSLQPQVLVSYKQGLLGTEDFRAPERHYQREGDELLEICNTMQPYAWGYDRDNDVGHKTPDCVMEMLAHTQAMNANLLLNIGPLPDGTVFPDDVTNLREVGKRLKAAQGGLDLVYEYVGVAVQQEGMHVWGTSPVIGKDGKTHLFVAQWPMPENKKDRFSGYYKTSEIAHYVGDSPEGPFEFVRMVVRDQDGALNAPHNPTIQFIDDQYVLCFIVNSNEDRGKQRIIMYVADDPNGEWRPAKGAEPDGTILRRPDNTSIWCHTSVRGVANPALIKHNGEYRIYFKAAIPDPEKEPSFSNREFGYGVATSKNLEGPYEFYPDRLTSEEIELEDVYAFSYDDRVYMLSRDIAASLGGKEGGLLWVSKDGINFPKEKTTRAFESLATYLDEGALDGTAKYRGSEKGQLERPQLLIVDGEPAYLYVATGLSPEEGCGSCSHVFKLNVTSNLERKK